MDEKVEKMKKILIGAILASTLAMSGNLEKCSHAIDQIKKYDIEKDNALSLQRKVHEGSAKKRHYYGTSLFGELERKWKEVAKVECKGVIDKEIYKNMAKEFRQMVYEVI